jgi:hypothetical protein
MSKMIRLLAAASFWLWIADISQALAQVPDLPSQSLATWAPTVTGAQLTEMPIGRQFSRDEEIRPFTNQTVAGLGVTGMVHFDSDRGMVRVLLTDDQQHEYLLYETFPLIASATDFNIESACRETCLLASITPATLRVEIVDASLFVRSIVINQPSLASSSRSQSALQATSLQQLKEAQENEIVETLNRRIAAKGLRWIAGQTDFSRLSYAEKKRLLACAAPGPDAPPPNLQGAEYYTAGVFEVPSDSASAPEPRDAASAFVPAFDWRSRHGADQPGSPYFDGDLTGGGWMTSVKNQRCSDCWAHSALGATEALVNLYFDQHLDLDLSEQELVSCSGAGSCASGGNTGAALSYVQRAGIVDEACFAESGSDESCSHCCPRPQDRIRISSFESVNPLEGVDTIQREDNIKRHLVESGPLPFGIVSWWHTLVLVGYDTDPISGAAVWILKNSWGTGWGDHGYGRVIVPLTNLYLIYAIHAPVTDLVASYSVACRDADGDGYYNWGLGADPATVCNGPVNPIEDCNDSDPTVAMMTESGACTAPPHTDTTPPILTATASPSVLWPPNSKMVEVTVSGTIVDSESGVSTTGSVFTVLDDHGEVQPSGAIDVGADGSYAFTLLLEASRAGRDRNGRHYTIMVTGSDLAGNSASTQAVVTVPHDARREE